MTKQSTASILATIVISVSSLLLAVPANANTFTYQGQLVESGAPAAGPIDLAFRLYDSAAGGVQIGPEVTFNSFNNFTDGGEFTVALDFGAAAFAGEDRWLEIWVDGVALTPRQAVRPTPYAIHALMVGDGALPVPYASAVDFNHAGNSFEGSFSGSYSGSGTGLTNLNASNLSTGTVASGRFAGTYSNALTFPNAGNAFTGDGGGLMNIDWDNLVNVPPGFADGVDNTSSVWELNGNDAYYDAGNIGIGTSTTNALLTVGAGDGSDLQVGQAPQLNLIKDAVDDKFRIQLTGSGYSGYQLQIGRDDETHGIQLSGDVNATGDVNVAGDANVEGELGVLNEATIVGSVGIGIGPGLNSKLLVSAANNSHGVLTQAGLAAGSGIGLHVNSSGFSGLAKNAHYSGSWNRFDSSQGSFLLEVDPDGDTSLSAAPPGGGAIAWNRAMVIKTNGRIGMGTNSPDVKLHVTGNQLIDGNLTVFGDVVATGTVSMGLQVVEVVCGGTNCSAPCPAGKNVISGACSSLFDELRAFGPTVGDNGWFCDYNGGDGVNVKAFCANID